MLNSGLFRCLDFSVASGENHRKRAQRNSLMKVLVLALFGTNVSFN